MAESKSFDVVLFGATGFTGRLTAEYLAKVVTPRPLRWAIAGRSRAKLETLAGELAKLAPNGPKVQIVVADVDDLASLKAMARAAQVVATTVGPYVKYGEPLVQACVEEGADYVDLTGEPEFVDMLLERYHEPAAARRVKIVNACGFDSIPHDLGAYFALKQLEKRLPASARGQTPIEIEGFVKAKGAVSGGTWHSLIGAMSRAREQLSKKNTRKGTLPSVGADRKVGKMPERIRFDRDLDAWAVPMPTIDPQVVRRSARLLPEYGPDFRYGHYMQLKRLATVVGLISGLGAAFVLAQVGPTRKLLLKLRDPGEGPSAEQREKSWFKVTMRARGGGQEVRCEVRGGDPGYGETAKMLAESALCLALDRDRLPQHYGIVPTAAAMGMPLLERLRAVGIIFADITPAAAQAGKAEAATLSN